MMRLATIDPGAHEVGWAVFEGGELEAAGLIECPSLPWLSQALYRLFQLQCPSEAVVEIPQVYPQRSWKGDPNDLIDVAVVAGAAVAALSFHTAPELVRPHAWKGNRPKAVDNRLTKSLLNRKERALLSKCGAPARLMHNVVDAVGIGLWKLRRR